MSRKIACMFALFVGCASNPSEGNSDALRDELDGGAVESDLPPSAGDAGQADELTDARVSLPFTLTSPVLVEGGAFPVEHTCDGMDVSPALVWTSAPQDAKSFVLVFSDLDAQVHGEEGPFVHWALFNIPQALHALPEDIGKGPMPSTVPGASQVRAWSAFGGALGGNHYLGPCPREPHRYEFTLYALSSETLDGVDTKKQPREIALAVMTSDAVLAKTTLSALYTPMR